MAMLTNFDVAEYWLTTKEVLALNLIKACDLGEPTCFACGYYAKFWDEVRDIQERWNKARLDKAHLTPWSLGGRNDATNIVLLCERCHQKSPDYIDPLEMLNWMKNKKHWMKENAENAIDEICLLGLSQDNINFFGEQDRRLQNECIKEAANNIAAHFGYQKVKPTTLALAFRDALRILERKLVKLK